MTVLLSLVSHGATAATRQASFPADEPLSDSQVVLKAPSQWRGRKVLSSPKTACRQTVQHLGLKAEVDADLCDLDYGRWSGLALTEVAQADPDALRRWTVDPAFRDHAGESRENLARRAAAWLDRIATGADHAVAVTHASVIRALVVHVLAAPPAAFWAIDVAPASVTELRHDGRRWALRSLGCSLSAAQEPRG